MYRKKQETCKNEKLEEPGDKGIIDVYTILILGGWGWGYLLCVISHSYSQSTVHHQSHCGLKHRVGHLNKGIDVRARGEYRKSHCSPLAACSLGERFDEGTSLGSGLTVSCILLAILKQDIVRRAW